MVELFGDTKSLIKHLDGFCKFTARETNQSKVHIRFSKTKVGVFLIVFLSNFFGDTKSFLMEFDSIFEIIERVISKTDV